MGGGGVVALCARVRARVCVCVVVVVVVVVWWWWWWGGCGGFERLRLTDLYCTALFEDIRCLNSTADGNVGSCGVG